MGARGARRGAPNPARCGGWGHGARGARRGAPNLVDVGSDRRHAEHVATGRAADQQDPARRVAGHGGRGADEVVADRRPTAGTGGRDRHRDGDVGVVDSIVRRRGSAEARSELLDVHAHAAEHLPGCALDVEHGEEQVDAGDDIAVLVSGEPRRPPDGARRAGDDIGSALPTAPPPTASVTLRRVAGRPAPALRSAAAASSSPAINPSRRCSVPMWACPRVPRLLIGEEQRPSGTRAEVLQLISSGIRGHHAAMLAAR